MLSCLKLVAKLAKQQTEGEKMLQILEVHGLLGCMVGDGKLLENYKLTNVFDLKQGANPARVMAEVIPNHRL